MTAKKSIKITKVEQWIKHFENKDKNWTGIEVTQLPNGKWACEIIIHSVNITAKAICNTEDSAKLSACKKAEAIIKEFLHNNMNASATIESIKNLGIKIGENGEFTSTSLSKKQSERENKNILWITRADLESVEKKARNKPTIKQYL